VRSFQIDRQEHTRFQVAKILWSLMEGAEEATTTAAMWLG